MKCDNLLLRARAAPKDWALGGAALAHVDDRVSLAAEPADEVGHGPGLRASLYELATRVNDLVVELLHRQSLL